MSVGIRNILPVVVSYPYAVMQWKPSSMSRSGSSGTPGIVTSSKSSLSPQPNLNFTFSSHVRIISAFERGCGGEWVSRCDATGEIKRPTFILSMTSPPSSRRMYCSNLSFRKTDPQRSPVPQTLSSVRSGFSRVILYAIKSTSDKSQLYLEYVAASFLPVPPPASQMMNVSPRLRLFGWTTLRV